MIRNVLPLSNVKQEKRTQLSNQAQRVAQFWIRKRANVFWLARGNVSKAEKKSREGNFESENFEGETLWRFRSIR